MPELLFNPRADEIGERIRKYREQHGLSQKQLAELAGITPPQLCRFEKGSELPTTPALARLAAVMGCSIDYLYHGRDDEILGKIDPLLRGPFVELQEFSEETRRAVYESAYAHMSREIIQKRARRNADTGVTPGNPKGDRNGS